MADDRIPMREMDLDAFMAEVRRRANDDRCRVPNFAVRRLLAALDAVTVLADEWTDGSYTSSSALDEDRAWVRAACGGKLREAITRALTGESGDTDG